jgi:hypothetical protein
MAATKHTQEMARNDFMLAPLSKIVLLVDRSPATVDDVYVGVFFLGLLTALVCASGPGVVKTSAGERKRLKVGHV